VPKSKGSKRSSLKRMTKGFFRLLGENGEIESAPVDVRLPLGESQCLMQLALLFARQTTKGALPPTVKWERLSPDEAAEPAFAELIETSSPQT